jgi:hypothetical protein
MLLAVGLLIDLANLIVTVEDAESDSLALEGSIVAGPPCGCIAET